jgi:carbonic anhydrase
MYYEGLIDQLKREIEEHKIRVREKGDNLMFQLFEMEQEKNREIDELNDQFKRAMSAATE